MSKLSYKYFVKALSNDTRLEIVHLLRAKPRCVSEICEELNLEQSRVSHNLKCLLNCGFVEAGRNGRKRVYSLNRNTILPLMEIIDKHIEKYYEHLVKCKVLKE
ncbi:metalloregulator ArsR/SmtB family transcription factor [Candidatus Hecatella orcuttiae]|jgi:DNA-binding transcriptional ArsR family regulator|uniref:ArsR/SmtB family transcription factor n=1 Tax=Candidatus Hecatella orcuttiae TaxID=1935119 RepID=UPI002868043F|nr:metalloregulator ArsR/SmtB family transcription factor [Candidatus Hecatella orcuttiae]